MINIVSILQQQQLQIPLMKANMPHDKGVFGVIRKHDIHTGIDLYCNDKDPVYAIADGYVKKVVEFTGFDESPWWNNTYAIIVTSNNVDILYGEVMPCVKVGDNVKNGQHIGNIERVLKKDKGLPTSMLHLECYINFNRFEYWYEKEKIPHNLLNPTSIINTVYYGNLDIEDNEFDIKNIKTIIDTNRIQRNSLDIETTHYLFDGVYNIDAERYHLAGCYLKLISYDPDTHKLHYTGTGYFLNIK